MRTASPFAVVAMLIFVSACSDDDDVLSEPGGEGGATGAGGAEFEPRVALEPVAQGQFASPVALKVSPDATDRRFVVDQVGTIHILSPAGSPLAEPFLDLTDRIVELRDDFDERGLLGLAFHPDYAQNGRFFVYYSAPLRGGAPSEYDHTSHISEFRVSASDANLADAASERIILQVDQPQFNHDAGQITFGPDGYLYIPLGDGGGADDVGVGHVEDWYAENEGGNGQDLQNNLLGSILRIDVDGGMPYAIPADNPFLGQPEILDETWAYGFRNPFRIAFDGDGRLFVGDAGQNVWEEVSIVEAGGNYGWNVKEGTHCFSTANPDESLATCPQTGSMGESLIDPIIDYLNSNQPNGLGLVVIGGHVYRGSELSGFQGRYVFGDWSRSSDEADGTLFVASPSGDASGPWSMQQLTVTNRPGGRIGEYVLSFGEDQQGEIYVLTSSTAGPMGTGSVYRLVSPN